ncbi:hypothetical protein WA538_004556 [Blastocystis sp. DL]
MNGMEYEKDGNGVMKRGCLFENGKMKRVVQEFNEGKMVEYDENGKKVYEGEFKGNVEKGFVREGFGKEFRMVEEKITSRAKPTIEIEKKRFCCWVREIEHEVAGVELVTKKYREEVVEGYWKDGKKNGMIYELDENGKAKRGCLYENDAMKWVVVEIKGSEMVEYDRNGKKVYEGKWFGDMKVGFSCHERMEGMSGYFKEVDSSGQLISVSEYDELNVFKNGKCFEMENGKVKRVCVYEKGVMKRVMQEFDGSIMVEYDENGKRVYEGGWKGDMKSGFVRDGEGKEMDGSGRVVKSGKWVDGEYQEMIVRNNGYNDGSVTELKLSWLVRLKRIVIGGWCFGKVRVFELDGLSELESVVIGWGSFRISDKERSDGSYRIVNCPKLKSIQIGGNSFYDYHSFELSNLPSLQSIYIGGDYVATTGCFRYAPSLSLTNLPQLQSVHLRGWAFQYVHSIVFENLPKLQSIQLGDGALEGDDRGDRKTISNDPYNFKNTMTMRNLPSLTEFKGYSLNFNRIGSVILENIPQLSSNGINFDTECFWFTYSLQSTNATGLENYLIFGKLEPSATSTVVRNRTEFNTIPLDVEDLWIGRFDTSDVSEFSPSRFQSLKTLVIGNGTLWSVNRLELNNLTSLQSIEMGEYCFYWTPSFSLTDLPQLQSLKLGQFAFGVVHSIVFENLPKLQSIQLDRCALFGDGRDDRKTISDKPYNYKNTLTMRNLPSLIEFKGDWYNFYRIGSVILENIPQLSSDGIQFGNYCFDYTYSLQSSNAAALESYIRDKSRFL